MVKNGGFSFQEEFRYFLLSHEASKKEGTETQKNDFTEWSSKTNIVSTTTLNKSVITSVHISVLIKK